MKLLDANVLLYLANTQSVHHRPIVRWWEALLADGEWIGLPWVVLLGFVRISTSPVVFPNPLNPGIAVEMVDDWMKFDQIKVVHEKEDHWDILKTLLIESGTAGNLTTDAHLAALAIGHGAVLASCDGDFSRFEGLRWENPLRSE